MAVNRRLAVLVLHLGTVLAMPAAASQPLAGDRTSFAEPSLDSEMSGLPQNLDVDQTLLPVLRAMWERSRTFRSQCARIEHTRSLKLVLRWGQAAQLRSSGARAEIVTLNGRTRAEIVVRRDLVYSQLVAVIAHEFEHIVEQLDGVRLTGRAQEGVTRDSDGTFETARATRIGQTVAHEMRRFGNLSSDRR